MARIFVYGTLMRGRCRSHVLRDQQFLGVARTEPRFQLYDTGSYPAMIRVDQGVAVEGEVWEISPDCQRIVDEIEGVPDLYNREPISLQPPAPDDVQAYLYRQPTTGMALCGSRWSPNTAGRQQATDSADLPLFVAQQGEASFSRLRSEVDIVCVGDSITGWNNFGPPQNWPYPTYPQFLQLLCSPRGLRVADGGIAGEVSAAGPRHVSRYLDWFAGASFFVIGFGTNDLSMSTDLQRTSGRIVANMRSMASLVARHNKQVLLLNIPHVRSDCSPPSAIDEFQRGRQYHNRQLASWCDSAELPLIDICLPLADEHLGDAVHPNEAGAKLIAETVFKTLGPLLATGTTRV